MLRQFECIFFRCLEFSFSISKENAIELETWRKKNHLRVHCSTCAAANLPVKQPLCSLLSHLGSSMFMKDHSTKPLQYTRTHFLVTLLLLTSALHSLWYWERADNNSTVYWWCCLNVCERCSAEHAELWQFVPGNGLVFVVPGRAVHAARFSWPHW